nr:UDP-N-acetylmuramoyl-tripeptide--D-alanyl-D-alanine ligase [Bacteroidota bacterium]
MIQAGIDQIYDLFRKHPEISTDSRKNIPGSLFFALKGENFNGNTYAIDALDRGAAYSIVDDKTCANKPGCILVNDVLLTLQELAKHHRRQFDIPVIGITGSNGKTTTKELTGGVLKMKYNTLVTRGNLNNHIGVPLTLLRITGETEIAVIEMGANHPGEIAALCKIADPNHGIITNIGRAHLEGFGSFEGVAGAKGELYEHLINNTGSVFVNGDDQLLTNMAAGLKNITYSCAKRAVTRGRIIDSFPFLNIGYNSGNEEITIKTKLVGDYNLYNILAAIGIGSHFGVQPEAIREAIENYRPDNNRSQFLETKSNKIILDAYNANPTSMEAAIKNFMEYPLPDKMVILGDMLELGGESTGEHQQIIELLIGAGFRKVILVGDIFSSIETPPDFYKFEDVKHAGEWIRKNPVKNRSILLKASRGIGLEKLLTLL